ncbi:MAG: AraC family transcriptional regulator [Flavobacteriaceae bacterium]|nr:AraC family transcriptional regulator [Flavobacteriaceae bacterium]
MTQITVEVSLPVILDILSISTSLMLGLLFIASKTTNRKANVILGLFLWSLALEVFSSLINGLTEVSFQVLESSLFTIPFLFIYINQTLNKKIKWVYLLLFIPGILSNISSLHLFEYVFNISLLVYILYIVKKHFKKVKDYYSDIENKTLSWIKTIVYIFLFFHLLWIIEDLVGLQNEALIEYFVDASNILTFFMIYWIGYNGFSQPEIFKTSLFLSKEKKETITNNTSETKKQFLEITTIILDDKLFTDTDLNLFSLSIKLNLKEKELSKLINRHTNNNFYHFINQLRVNEFKKLLSSSKAKRLSLLGLAEEAGFYSKSTFYTAFKNLEGLTPKQFQNQLKKSE